MNGISTDDSLPITHYPSPPLTGFGDEVAHELDEQLDLLLELGVQGLDLRGVWQRNVLTLTDDEVRRVRDAVATRGMWVSVVASPVGKAPVGGDFGEQTAALARALEIAALLDCRQVRIFSWYIPRGDDPARWRDVVLERMSALVRLAEAAGVVLLHENESEIYGDTPARCHDLLSSIDAAHLRAVWDPANFVHRGFQRPHDAGYELLRPYIANVHVKDCLGPGGRIVGPGQGQSQWRETLAALHASGYDGAFSMEPHLQVAGRAGGFTGPELYHEAVDAFRALLDESWR